MTDAALLHAMEDVSVTKVAIDAPFGWPTEFVHAITAWHEQATWPLGLESGGQQLPLVLRATDRDVWHGDGDPRAASGWHGTGRRPLSVSTDRIAFAAMRCARLLHALAKSEGRPIDRSGQGRVLEVYPEAALRRWEISSWQDPDGAGGYKGSSEAAAERRLRLLNRLRDRIATVVDLDSVISDCARSDDSLDALVCALIARAAEVGALLDVSDPAAAKQEGWIRLPTSDSLSRLV